MLVGVLILGWSLDDETSKVFKVKYERSVLNQVLEMERIWLFWFFKSNMFSYKICDLENLTLK